MLVTKLRLKNWKNFSTVEVPMSSRVFIIGNNGTGKSNLLDSLRFLRDIANPKGGGLQSAMEKRGGMKQVRSVFTRQKPVVSIGVDVAGSSEGDDVTWSYDISVAQDQNRRVLLESEMVKKNNKIILQRPNDEDKKDPQRLTQTALEQTFFNQSFRELSDFFRATKYLHIVPQLIRHGNEIQGRVLQDDPFGQGLMEEIAATSPRQRNSYLKRIYELLGKVKPLFKSGDNFKFELDPKTGKGHLWFHYLNWRRHDLWQNEEILSDGELRLIGLLWALLASNKVILLEEPELSFNDGIVEELPNIFMDAIESKKKKKGSQQIILTTHSRALLSDTDIIAEEVLLLRQGQEATEVICAAQDERMKNDMESEIPAALAVLPFAQSRFFY